MTEWKFPLMGENWTWIHRVCPPEGCCLVFARGITAEQMIAAYSLDPGSARLLSQDRKSEAFEHPIMDGQGQVECPVIATGRGGEWAFAIDDGFLALNLATKGQGLALPEGTEGALVRWTGTIDTVEYWSGYGLSASFEPGMDDPEMFLGEAGLDVEVADQVDFDEAERPYLAALDMLTLAIGLQLSEEIVTGPLLYCQRPPSS
jgi:hypothetical protein